MDFLTHLSLWHWWALAILCLAIEIVAPSAYFLWPAGAAFLIGVALWFAPGLDWTVQFLAFSIMTISALIVWRAGPWRKAGVTDHPLLNRRGAQYISRAATVTEDFHGGRGQVDLDDTRWGAETVDGSNPLAGTGVEIIAVDGSVLRVALPNLD